MTSQQAIQQLQMGTWRLKGAQPCMCTHDARFFGHPVSQCALADAPSDHLVAFAMLAGLMDPPFEALEAQIEGMWRELLPGDLSLFPMPHVRPSSSLSAASSNLACKSVSGSGRGAGDGACGTRFRRRGPGFRV